MKKYIAVSAITLSMAMLVPMVADAKKESKGNKGKRDRSSQKSYINKERLAIGRALIEVQSSNWPEIMPYYADDIEYHDAIVDIYGKATMTAFLAQLFSSSPDLVTTIEDETCVDGIYSASWVMVGEFNGVPYNAPGMSIVKFRPGETQAYYQRDYYTEGDIMGKIPGLDQAVLGFRTYYKCAVDPTFECPPLEPPPQ